MIYKLAILCFVIFICLFVYSTAASAVTDNGLSIIRDELSAQGLNESEVDVMMKIAKCESTYGLNLDNPTSTASGWWGITKGTWESNSDYDWELRYDWLANLETAAKIYKARNTQPWNTSKHCWNK